ncbi:MAG TPA: TIGR04563 family protein [Anaeromyxobacter sp.]|nr:TIGR04563 family protein [Anaeromyxobacter sp.]
MASTDKQKQSLYFPEDMLREIMAESVRLDRSLSWTVQQAWRVARAELRRFPAMGERPQAGPQRAPVRAGEERRADGGERPSAQVLEFLRGKFDRELAG